MKKKLLWSILWLSLALPGFAHPHMYLTARLELEYQGDLCQGFWVDWVFDPYFSASIIQEHDKNKDKRFDAEETKAVFNGAFYNLRKYGYFTYIRQDSDRVNPPAVEQFSASVRGELLAYRFYVPVNKKGDVNIAIIDTTYFCAVRYPAETVATISQRVPGSPIPHLSRAINKQYPVYYDPSQTSTDNSKHTKWRPGLETAYPEEIRATF